MSNKTLLKRISLGAVTALGAGLLSVVSIAPAHAAAGDIIAELTDATGVCSVVQSSAFLASNVGQPRSTLAAPATVTIAVGGTMGYSKPTVTDQWTTWSSNGVMTHATAGTLHSSYGVYAFNSGGSTSTQTLTANAVGTFTIKSYNTAAPYSAVNTPAATSVQASQLNITVVASCASTGYSATYSSIQVSGAYNATPSNTAGDVLKYVAGDKAYINIIGKNGYNAVLPSGTVWAAQATNGAKVSIGTSTAIDDTTTADGTNSFASTSAAGTNISVRVGTALATALSTTVTVTADGATVATKTIDFTAEAAKLVIVKSLVGSISAGEGAFLYSLTDAAGNAVSGSIAGVSTSYTSRITSVTNIKGASLIASDISPAAETINTVDAGSVFGTSTSSTSVYGVAKFACSASTSTGSSPITLRFTTSVGAVDVDTVANLSCAKGLDTYTVSTDKAAYRIGEIATITITAKDSSGAAVNDFTTLSDTAISAGGGTMIKNSVITDAFSGGVKTYQAQMTTAGTFNAVVTLSGTVTKAATTGYSVSAATTEVTNAEVLKSIVALIASINKQIQALQKLILKR
jgi:hypothetical protein